MPPCKKPRGTGHPLEYTEVDMGKGIVIQPDPDKRRDRWSDRKKAVLLAARIQQIKRRRAYAAAKKKEAAERAMTGGTDAIE